MMCEFAVTQRTPPWYSLRDSVCLTASLFADALGLGRGKPYHFLSVHVANEDGYHGDETAECCHGIEFEPVINEAYRRLTGRWTVTGGFWVAAGGPGERLSGLVGASPDAKVSGD